MTTTASPLMGRFSYFCGEPRIVWLIHSRNLYDYSTQQIASNLISLLFFLFVKVFGEFSRPARPRTVETIIIVEVVKVYD